VRTEHRCAPLHRLYKYFMLTLMDEEIPVIVRMRVHCGHCGHIEDETYEFDLPFEQAQPLEASEPGRCPDCGAAIRMELRRTRQVQ
jgi:ribosomal protein S27AE